MKKYLLIFFIIIFKIYPHDLEHATKKEGNCIVVELYFSDNTKFSYEEYEIYYENEDAIFQTGRTDALGRVVFCPDRANIHIDPICINSKKEEEYDYSTNRSKKRSTNTTKIC
jgi:hypothetical protein